MLQAVCYVFHSRFDDFWAQALRARPAVVFLEPIICCATDHGVPSRSTSAVVVSWHAAGLLHAVRLPVDDLSLVRPNPAQVHDAVVARANVAADILAEYCAQHALHGERGMLLVGGLYADLLQLTTDHQLWHLAYDDANDPLCWSIRPGAR